MQPFTLETEIGKIHVLPSQTLVHDHAEDYWIYLHELIAKLLIEEYKDSVARARDAK